MFCPLMQKGTNANNVKNIFFIINGFYRLAPLGLVLPPMLPPFLLPDELLLKLPLLLDEELLLGLLMLELLLLEEELLLGLLTLELLLLEEELLLGLTYSELERT